METEAKDGKEEGEKQTTAPETKESLVYAELDLVSQNLKPVVKGSDEKTEYAEIVYTPKDSNKSEEEGKEK